nr:hypothetical protein [Tanacetum cinerariifolium]
MVNGRVEYHHTQNASPSEIKEPYQPSPRMYSYEQPSCLGSNFTGGTLKKNDQLHQTFEKSSIAMTRKLDDMIELPKSQPKRTYNEDLFSEIVMVKMPKCMAWLDDEPIDPGDGVRIYPDDVARIVPLFNTMLVNQGEGSGTPTEPHHIPFPKAETSHPTTSSIPLPSIPTAPIPTVTQPDLTPIKQYTRRARIAQSAALPTVADEPASPVRDVNEREACPTDSGFIADQDRATIAKSFTLPRDSAPREEIGRLKEWVQVIEDREGVATKQSRDDAPIKGRSTNEGEAAAKRISNDSEEIARVLTSMDAATVLAGEIDVPTGSGFIPTAGPPATIISTGSERRPMTKKQKREYYMAVIKSNLGWRFKDFKGMTFEEIEAEFVEVWKQAEDFIPMGSKEETERLKRKGLNLEKEQVKKQKSSEEAPEIKTSTEEFTEVKMKEMMQLVPVEDVYVQALQVKHPIIDWKVHTKGQRSYWQIIRLGGSSTCYHFFVDLLKQLDMKDLNQLWALVKEYLSIRPATNDKEIELWVKLKRMYEPDPEDQLWNLTQNFIHAPVE